MKIWETKLPGTLWATPGLYGTTLPALSFDEIWSKILIALYKEWIK